MENLKQEIESLDRFFSKIVNLIPSHLYQHTLSADAVNSSNEVDSKYYKHKKQPLAADERKKKSKLKILEVYNSAVATDSQSEIVNVVKQGDNELEGGNYIPAVSNISSNLEELRLKLQEKLIGFRLKRTSTKNRTPDDKKSLIKSRSNSKENKLKLKSTKKPNEKVTTSLGSSSSSRPGDDDGDSQALSVELRTVQQDLQFSNMVLPKSSSAPASNAAPSGSKTQRLQRLLAETEKKRKRLQELSKAENPNDSKKLKTELWNDALKAASGEKPITGSKDSELKIKKALKRKQKMKEKSALQWQQRLDAVEEAKASKAQKREQNLLVRQGKAPVEPAADATTATTSAGGAKSSPGGRRGAGWQGGRGSPGGGRGGSGGGREGSGAGRGGHGQGEEGGGNKGKSDRSSRQGKSASNLRRPGFEGRFKQGEFLNKET